jgi:hypothetical protein
MVNIVTHQSHRSSFKANPRNGIIGNLPRTFKRSHLARGVGELFAAISREMMEDRIVFAHAAKFALVNVTNMIHGSSIGYSPAPPSSVLGTNPGLVFTFALTTRPYQEAVTIRKVAQNYDGSEFISYWSDSSRTFDYLSIAFDKNSLRDYNLSYNTTPEMVYLYNTIGILSKSFVLNSRWYDQLGNVHQSAKTKGVTEFTLYSKYYEKPLRNLVNDVPMNAWIYNKDFWIKASNLLTTRFLDIQEFGLYYLLYLHDVVPNNRSPLYLNINSSVGGIRDYLTQGVKDLYTKLRNPSADMTDNCYAVLHFLQAGIDDGGFGLVVDREAAEDLLLTLRNVFEYNKTAQKSFDNLLLGQSAFDHLTETDPRVQDVMEGILG